MKMRMRYEWLAIAALGVSIAACQQKSGEHSAEVKPAVAAAEHSHEGWWCDEHGVPEEECAQCHPKLVAGFKAKNDWCEKHNRPDSQCFVCHPEKEAEYASLYEAKYGKKPPKPESGAAEGGEKAKS